MMKDVNVSQWKTKMDKKMKKRELPCVRRSISLYKGRVVRGVVSMSKERKKVMKKQRRSK
jgi:hypothetical protein